MRPGPHQLTITTSDALGGVRVPGHSSIIIKPAPLPMASLTKPGAFDATRSRPPAATFAAASSTSLGW